MPYSESHLREAIRLADEKMTAGDGGPFGAIIVKDHQVISRGWNCVTSENDPTAHAEIMAIRAACATLESFSLKGCEIYSSCEPCPMCLAAIHWARLDALYFSATHQDATDAGFDDSLLYEEIRKKTTDRALKTERYLMKEGRKVFTHWKNKSDKVVY
jgi:guanine deaminase